MIRVKPRAAVPEAFTDHMLAAARLRLRAMQEEMGQYSPRYRQRYVQANAITIARLKKLIKDPVALDMEVTRLRGLPFTEYWFEEEGGYFAGQTKDILVTEDKDTCWNLGPYKVYLSQDAFARGRVAGFSGSDDPKFHFVPVREPMAEERHMHHVAHASAQSHSRRKPAAHGPLHLLGRIRAGHPGQRQGLRRGRGAAHRLYLPHPLRRQLPLGLERHPRGQSPRVRGKRGRMKIEIKPEIYALLMDAAHLTGGREFSGLGFCERAKDTITIYDFVMLDIGSEVFTEIPPEVILPLLERSDAGNMKAWVHVHPLGDGVPGRHNWSGTDENTIHAAPLGGIPEAVRWSASIVLTPKGWVGRVDNHLTKKTIHCEVFPKSQAAEMLQAVLERKRKATLSRAAVWMADLFTQAELAEYGLTREEWTREIAAGLEDGSLLPGDLTPMEWASLLDYLDADYEEAFYEPYQAHGYFRRQYPDSQFDRSGRDRGGRGAGARKDGRHGHRGVRR